MNNRPTVCHVGSTLAQADPIRCLRAALSVSAIPILSISRCGAQAQHRFLSGLERAPVVSAARYHMLPVDSGPLSEPNSGGAGCRT